MKSRGINFRQALQLTLLLGIFALIIHAAGVWERWNTKGKLPPHGGRYFFSRVEIPGPRFLQNDPRWGDDRLGPADSTLGAEGCAVSSAAMVLASYGIDTDPGRLNRFLLEHGGFTPRGWMEWSVAATLAPERVQHVYEDSPTYHLIDANIALGNPVIVRVRLANGVTHFVVLAGKEGYDYLVRDPAGGRKELYPLRELGRDIEALRYYRKLL
jgi:hypothetical protein